MTAIGAKRTNLSILANCRKEVDQLIEAEIPRIRGLRCEIIEIASDVGLAIDNVYNAWDYAELLTKLADDVDEVAKDQIKEIEAMVADLKEKNPLVLVNLSSRAISLIESLVLKGWQPKVLGVRRYAWVVDGCFEGPIFGRFKYTVSSPDTCSLDIPGLNVFRPKVHEGGLTFKIANRFQTLITDAEMRYCHFVRGKLEVQYDTSYNPFKISLKTARFGICFGLFPKGVIVSLTRTVQDRHEEVEKTEEISLTWGKTYPFSAKKFKVAFERPDGSRFACDQLAKTKELSVIALEGGTTFALMADKPLTK